MKVLLLTCLIAVTLCVTNANKDCPSICTLEHAPVCGINKDGVMKMFSNKCQFLVHQCNNGEQKWTLNNEGPCHETALHKMMGRVPEGCPKLCTREMMPCCGRNKDGKLQEFSNYCVFENERQCEHPEQGWSFLGFAKCNFFDMDPCPKACTMDFRSVCGQSGHDNEYKTFSNPCMFRKEQCEQPEKKWFLASEHGACDSL